ncbi:mannosyltransferase [Plakobranchus ocellatus]|uniref:Mannosyltransferase n=1 Tax=Plakobranchus ocellatus TaxID=259542 RepID=A0AAV4B8C2_9GAST|nr:mannosyltransferase [Plakobranchus ocellatus]
MNKLATILLCVNFITVLFPQPGYIHPDEFFQSTEIVAGDVLDVIHYRAWEFNATFPVRSIVFPYILTSPPLYLLQMLNSTGWSGLQISTVKVVMSTRLPLAFLSVLGYLATGKLAETFQADKHLSTVLFCSSYVTWTYYTRTFSNSIESVLLAIVFLLTLQKCNAKLITQGSSKVTRKSLDSDKDKSSKVRKKEPEEDKREPQEKHKKEFSSKHEDKMTEKQSKTNGGQSLTDIFLGIVVAAGIFNRPTFVLFSFIPTVFWLSKRICPLQQGWYKKLVFACFRFTYGASITSAVFILADTIYYKPLFVQDLNLFLHLLFSGEMSASLIGNRLSDMLSTLVITPINFLSYNTDPSNLAQHGLHPRILHIFVNLPLLLGPVYISFVFVTAASVYQLLFGLRNAERKFEQTSLSWLVLMAVIPVLALSIFPHQEPRFIIPTLPVFMVMGAKFISVVAPAKLSFLTLWVLFNILLTLIYGYMHQAALIPAMSIYQQKLSAMSSKPLPGSQHTIFYKTYPPPRHLLLLPSLSSQHVHIHDLAGGPVASVKNAIEESKLQCKRTRGSCQIFLFMPATVTPRVEDQLSESSKVQRTSICPHLSMEAPPRLKAWWRKKIGFEEFVMEFCLNILKIT